MKKINFLASLLLVGALVTTSCNNSSKEKAEVSDSTKVEAPKFVAKTFLLDTLNSKMEWIGKKVLGQHNGTIKISEGTISVDSLKNINAGNFTIDMKSIVCLDLTDAKDNAKLIKHLKSDDFFAVDKNPTAKFEIATVTPIANATEGTPNYTIKGNLTIKGITKAIEFPATITIADDKLKMEANFDVDRTEWDIKYGSGKFFKGLGDKMINDNFTIKYKVEAKPQS